MRYFEEYENLHLISYNFRISNPILELEKTIFVFRQLLIR
jgi:hypothetical protein